MPNAKFAYALQWANEKHWDQRRNSTDIPYISHLMTVSALVMEAGGTAEEAIAALLHDVLEDCEDVGQEDVANRFGDRVAEIVLGLSDADIKPGMDKGPWKERKVAYLEHLKSSTDQSILLVSNADKLHNASCIKHDLEDPEVGPAVWKRFQASKDDTVWYYQSLSEVFLEKSPSKNLARRLADTVSCF